MPDLLIHSMSAFSDIIFDALRLADARDIVEIGSEFGGMSQNLERHAAATGGKLTSIDPAPKAEFLDWAAHATALRHIAMPSLDAIDTLSDIDAWVIDGDHNWYTVYHELTAVEAVCRRDQRPMLVFLHDVGWPWARRDLYYTPESIPVPFRHPYDYAGGVLPGIAQVIPNRGFQGMGQFAPAVFEGGPRNGVLTAIEDFLASSLAEGREYGFAEIPGVFGLGVIFALDAPWSGAMADHLIPFHNNALLAALESNRLANYLHVLDIQDRAAA
jgi:hypothetical protein